MDVAFERTFDPRYGEPVRLSPMAIRVVARNPSAFTFHGTASYLVGGDAVALIDPGPDDPAHRAALLAAAAGRPVHAILVTHGHHDHVAGAGELAKATGAPVLGAGASRPRAADEGGTADAGRDAEFAPDRLLVHGERVAVDGATIECLETPGHAADHMAFALLEENALFSGDHVMGWSTTVIAPPDGHMTTYLNSLRLLLARPERSYYPGHGGPIENGPAYVRGLLAHRLAREQAIAACLANGLRTVPEIVARLYAGLSPALVTAARLSVLAHLERLIEQGRAIADPSLSVDAVFQPA